MDTTVNKARSSGRRFIHPGNDKDAQEDRYSVEDDAKLVPPSPPASLWQIHESVLRSLDDNNNNNNSNEEGTTTGETPTAAAFLMLLSMMMISLSDPANAATTAPTSSPIASALVAYVHYLSILLSTGALVVERLMLLDGVPTLEKEKIMFQADTVYELAGLGLAISGFLRVTQYGKGWEFYSHEPIFWVKLCLVSIWGAASFFPTVILIKRNLLDLATTPMSEALAARMTTVINSELLAILSIPLSATLMSRGVLYNSDIPWQVEAVLTVGVLGGFGYKYLKEAFTWEDDDSPSAP